MTEIVEKGLGRVVAQPSAHVFIRQKFFNRTIDITDADIAAEILRDNETFHLEKTFLTLFHGMFDTGIMGQEGAPWKSRRQMLHVPFRQKSIEDRFRPIMESESARIFNRLALGQSETVNVFSLTEEFTCAVIARGLIESPQIKMDIAGLVKDLQKRPNLSHFAQVILLQQGLPIPFVHRRPRSPDTLSRPSQDVMNFIRKARDEGYDKNDILSDLLKVKNPDGSALTESEIYDQITSLLLAGFFTTQTAIAFAIDEMTKEPAILERAVAEARSDGTQYPLIENVVKESLRLHPPVHGSFRNATKPVSFGALEIKPSDMLRVDIRGIQRNAAYFNEPDKFDPDRFNGPIPKNAYIPFGYGLRSCIGQRLAMQESVHFIVALLKNFDIETTQHFEGERKSIGFMVPRGELKIQVQPV
ncbi:MAG: cytochrome P450 [Alphaproteobacteria bacterium]|nr:cytochrome P450 [Alphaproteobacteria bacterium]